VGDNLEKLNDFELPDKVVDKIPVGLCKCKLIFDNENEVYDIKFIDVNDFMADIIGLEKYEIRNRTMTELFPQIQNSIFNWIKIFGEAAVYGEYKHIEQYVDIFNKYLTVGVVGSENDEFYMVMNDITDKRQYRKSIVEKDSEIAYINNEMRKKANLDNLTLAYNYQFIMKILKEETQESKDRGRKLSVALLDIDDFNEINRTYGFDIGDRILEKIGIALRNSIRKIDSLGRTGGDEFLLIMTNVDIDIAKIVIERVKTQILIDTKNFENLTITVSGAVAEYDGETYEEFYHNLRDKVFKAKSLGKNMIIF
jgi:diguanylate cyclase (GGDEF)-like protein